MSLFNASETGDGTLSSLRYFDRARSEATDVSRRRGSNVDVFTDPNNGETVVLCHISLVSSFTHGDFVPSLPELEHAFSVALALQHLNTGDGHIVPEVAGLNERCPVRFTLELADDEFQGGVALGHVVEQTGRSPPDRVPCAFIGALRSSASMPMSIATGLYGYPQVSATSTSVQLDDKSLYPLFGRTVPSDAGNAVPIVIYMHQALKVEHLAVINVNDSYGNDFVDGLRAAAAIHAPDMVIQQIPIDEGQVSVTGAVQSLKATGFRFVFCILFGQDAHDALLTEAYNNGLVGDGGQTWLFADSFGGIISDREFEKDSPLAKAYQGAGMLEASGGGPGLRGYDKYTSELVNLKTTTDLNYMGSLLPKHNNSNYPASYEENPFLFEDTFLEPLTSGYTPFHYEAAIALGLSACDAFRSGDSMRLRGLDHFAAFRNTTFPGVTETVRFDPATGTRPPTSTLYQVTNWVATDNGNGMLSFEPVVSDLFLNGTWTSQQPYVFNDGTTQLPSDVGAASDSSSGGTNLALAIALPVVLVVALLSVLAAVWYRRKHRKRDDAAPAGGEEAPQEP